MCSRRRLPVGDQRQERLVSAIELGRRMIPDSRSGTPLAVFLRPGARREKETRMYDIRESPVFSIDFYKADHVHQYPTGLTRVYSNWTPRYGRDPSITGPIVFGLQYYLTRLVQRWQEGFFDIPFDEIRREYSSLLEYSLGVTDPRLEHLSRLHEYGALPIEVWALPEGTLAPYGVPQFVIRNSNTNFPWFVNYLETDMSNVLWKPSTSATKARTFRQIFEKYARLSGETDLSFVDWQGHDFSYRGMSGKEDAVLSGLGHLLFFSGTDTVPAIMAAMKYYDAPPFVGGSVNATEHSVMCAGGCENELETFRRLVEDVYPDGIVSVVSDTWDLWRVLTEYVPALREKILARNGKVVIRPDSGDPVKIVAGDSDAKMGSPQNLGVIALLATAMGIESLDSALPKIRKMGTIYGDGMSPERVERILDDIVRRQRLSSYNFVAGIGSYTYEYVTRDQHGFAMKATAIEYTSSSVVPIFKSPVTDDVKNPKVSHRGIPLVYEHDSVPTNSPSRFYVVETTDPRKLDDCTYVKVFDQELIKKYDFATVRATARATL